MADISEFAPLGLTIIRAPADITAKIRRRPLAWAAKYMRTERGSPLNFEMHPYMQQPLNDWWTAEWGMMCASQVGKTTIVSIRTYWLADNAACSIIFTMHTAEEVSSFAQVRAKPAIQFSDYLSQRIGNVDSVARKVFKAYSGHGQSVIHYKGASVDSQALSVPADMVVHDEVDYSRPDVIELYRDRTAHSELGYRAYIGTPTFPGFPMSRLWDRSTQFEWHVPCAACSNKDIVLSPDVLAVDDEGGIVHEADWYCPRCQAVLPNERIYDGVWVPHGPKDADLRMYHVSRPMLPHLWPPERVAKEALDAQFPRHYLNNVWGLPAVEGDRSLDEQVLTRCLGGYGELTEHEGSCFAGIDVGAVLNLWIGRDNPDTGTRDWLCIRRITSVDEAAFDEVDTLLDRFNVRMTIIDALPEQRLVRSWVNRDRQRRRRAFYDDHRTAHKQKGEARRDRQAKGVVALDRTAVLDVAAERFIQGQDRLPRMDPIKQRDVFGQLCNMVRVTEEHEDTGERKIVYHKAGDDHDRHAHSYATQAAAYMTSHRAPAQMGVPLTDAAPQETTGADRDGKIVRRVYAEGEIPMITGDGQVIRQYDMDSINRRRRERGREKD